MEAELEPRKVENERIDAVSDIRDGVTEREFQQRLRIAETKLKEKDLNIKEKAIDLKFKRAEADAAAGAELDNMLGDE